MRACGWGRGGVTPWAKTNMSERRKPEEAEVQAVRRHLWGRESGLSNTPPSASVLLHPSVLKRTFSSLCSCAALSGCESDSRLRRTLNPVLGPQDIHSIAHVRATGL